MRIYMVTCDKCGEDLSEQMTNYTIRTEKKNYDLCDKCFEVFNKKHSRMQEMLIKQFCEFNPDKIIKENTRV